MHPIIIPLPPQGYAAFSFHKFPKGIIIRSRQARLPVYEPSARYGPDPHPPQSPKSALTVCCPLKFCAHYNTPRTNPAPRLEYAPSHNDPACAEKSVRETPLPPHDKSTSAQLFPAPKPAGEDKVNSPSPIHSRALPKIELPLHTSDCVGHRRGISIPNAAAIAAAVFGPGIPSGVTFTAAWTADHISGQRRRNATGGKRFRPRQPIRLQPQGPLDGFDS